jgi:hypothetical protein
MFDCDDTIQCRVSMCENYGVCGDAHLFLRSGGSSQFRVPALHLRQYILQTWISVHAQATADTTTDDFCWPVEPSRSSGALYTRKIASILHQRLSGHVDIVF